MCFPCLSACAAPRAAALVPNQLKPFVPFRARAFTPQQQRQQVVSKLLGSYLVLLMKELQVQPQQQQQVGQPTCRTKHTPYRTSAQRCKRLGTIIACHTEVVGSNSITCPVTSTTMQRLKVTSLLCWLRAPQVIRGSPEIMQAAGAASLAQEAALYKEVTSAQVGTPAIDHNSCHSHQC